MDERVYVILLNYNGYEDTINCINSLKQCEESLVIVVVDNDSPDGSADKLERVNGIKLIKNNNNSGFAKGNNLGIEYALNQGAEYVLLLNNDTEVRTDTIKILKEKLISDKELGIVGSRIMYYEKKNLINYYGGHINWLKGITVHEHMKEEYSEKLNKGSFFYTDFITGCTMLIRREVFKTIGLLPEEYFMYYEDADFCVQVIEHGYKIGICSDSVVYHKVSASSGGENNPFMIKWTTRNRLLFIKKYKKYTKGLLTVLFFYISRIYKYFKNIIKGDRKSNKAIIDGISLYFDYVKNQKVNY